MPAPHVRPLHLLVMAGGLGARARRADAEPPKQFLPVNGASLMLWGIRELVEAPGVVTVTVAVPEAWLAMVRGELAAARLPCAWLVVPGGETRTGSARRALEALCASRPLGGEDLVAVHDAARPFASRGLLARVAAAAAAHGAAVPGVAVTDTIGEIVASGGAGAASGDAAAAAAAAAVDDGQPVARYLERDALRALQTPQVFRGDLLLAAHRWAREHGRDFTDDGGLLAARGCPPVVVSGEPGNWKVTTDADLARAEHLLRAGGGPA
ncbi:MAG: IspD/TarI family cytidylyltransferase [Candidatus Krumholzibacteriia bacterium]